MLKQDEIKEPVGCPHCASIANIIIDGPVTARMIIDDEMKTITYWEGKCSCGWWGIVSDGSLDINQIYGGLKYDR